MPKSIKNAEKELKILQCIRYNKVKSQRHGWTINWLFWWIIKLSWMGSNFIYKTKSVESNRFQ